MPNTYPPLPADTAVLLLAAGSGSRFGHDKMWVPLDGRPLVSWSLKTFLDLRPGYLVMVGRPPLDRFSMLDDRPYACVCGGQTRRQSVLAGLAALPPHVSHILIHDAARAGVSPRLILEVREALNTAPAALPALPLSDTIKDISCPQRPITLNRKNLRAAQTPQGFVRTHLERALDRSSDQDQETDEIQAIEALKLAPALMTGDPCNLKITTPEDLTMLSSLLTRRKITVTGSGFDVHRFCTPEEARKRTLILGGLPLPGEHPLAGHSDADVLLHALCDGIYGALGDGDIGKHFPPCEAKWKDQDSALFLDHALKRCRDQGGELIHIDLTLICQTPKLRTYEDAMKDRLSKLTTLPVQRIGLKATTTEHLGFLGRKEGIAAQATVTLRLPA